MIETTPTPWNAASAYSSVCGVPIVNQRGQRVGNTALPDMPKEWDELKQRAVADAALIVDAVNSHAALMDFAKWVDTWVSNPVGAYSVSALDGLFKAARDKIAALPLSKGEA